MKTLSLLILCPPLMAAHGLILLSEQPGSAHNPDGMTGLKYENTLRALNKAHDAATDADQAHYMRRALTASPDIEGEIAGLIEYPLLQIDRFARRIEIDLDDAHPEWKHVEAIADGQVLISDRSIEETLNALDRTGVASDRLEDIKALLNDAFGHVMVRMTGLRRLESTQGPIPISESAAVANNA